MAMTLETSQCQAFNNDKIFMEILAQLADIFTLKNWSNDVALGRKIFHSQASR